MIEQLSLLPSLSTSRLHERGIRLKAHHQRRPVPAYVIQGQEKPADLPSLQESAATVEARVLAWFEGRFGVRGYLAQTPTMCAEALGLEWFTVRPRISQLAKRIEGPRLEHCAWLPRKPTGKSSEGWYRFKEGGGE